MPLRGLRVEAAVTAVEVAAKRAAAQQAPAAAEDAYSTKCHLTGASPNGASRSYVQPPAGNFTPVAFASGSSKTPASFSKDPGYAPTV